MPRDTALTSPTDCSMCHRWRSAHHPTRHHGEGAGGATTGGRSLQVIGLGSIQGASRPASLPPRSVSENSDPAEVKWNDPQLLTPTAPTLRATTSWKDAEPAE